MLWTSTTGVRRSCEGITLDLLKQTGYMRLNVGKPDKRVPHAEGNFKTPSGKCEFKSSAAANGNFVVAGLAIDVRGNAAGRSRSIRCRTTSRPANRRTPTPELAKRYPLSIVSPKSHGFLNSCYANMDHKIKGQGEQFVMINQADALQRGIVDGDRVQVANGRGAFKGCRSHHRRR